jgi:hypothetical protein
MAADLARANGAFVERDGFLMPPEPERDWTEPERRPWLWRVLEAPDWALPDPPASARHGASYFLMRTAEADDVPRVVEHALAGTISVRIAAAHLAAAWLGKAEVVPPEARAMLEGDDREATLAALALALYTGLDAEGFDPFRIGWTLDRLRHEDWVEAMGATRAEVVERWRAWAASESHPSLAELHRDAALRWLRIGYHERTTEGFQLAERLVRSDDFRSWRRSAGVAPGGAAERWSIVAREELAARLEAGDPLPFPPRSLTGLVEYRAFHGP